MNKIYAILPVFNRITYTKECLDAFGKQDYKNFEVILVDSASSDGTVEFVKANYSFVKIIQGTSDWWWTKAMYEGVRWIMPKAKKGDFILEMNNDCYFGPDYLTQLLKSSKKYSKRIIGSLCVKASYPSFVVESGIRIDWSRSYVYGVAWTWSNKYKDYKNLKIVDNLDALPGKGTLIPIEVFRKIGNFNVRKLPHYIADYEFTNRAKRAGWDLIVDPKALIKHHWEATGDSVQVQDSKNSIKKAWQLLFGRRSMNNIVDWINFLILACPPKYLLHNFYIASWKIAFALFSVWPLYYARPGLFYLITGIAHLYNFSKTVIYKLRMYIIQFPEYHLGRSIKKTKK